MLLLLPALALAKSGADETLPMLFGGVFAVVYLAVAILMIAAMWKVFDKAGKPGWACLVPIYNIIVMLQIAGKPEWWVLLFLVPFVNIVIMIMTEIAIAQNFGRDTGFALGLIFLPVIFWPVLGFGGSRYAGCAQGMPADHSRF